MNVRIISGKFGGRRLDSPSNTKTHPMSEQIRNAIFNSLSTVIDDAVVLDAFAGTGAVGLEALSRGAKHVTFIERDRVAQNVLAKNITTLGVEGQTKIIRTTVSRWQETSEPSMFDIIFVDPPYHDPQFSTVESLFGLLKPNALMVLSHSGRSEAPDQTGVVVVDNRSYGNASLTFYRREDV